MNVTGSNTTDATIVNLIPSTMYVVQVAAINDAGDGEYSDPLTVSTNDSARHSETTMPTFAMEVTATIGPFSEPTTSEL